MHNIHSFNDGVDIYIIIIIIYNVVTVIVIVNPLRAVT